MGGVMNHHGRRGVTIVELAVLLVVIGIVTCVLAVYLSGQRVMGRAVSNTSYLRGIGSGLLVWQMNSPDGKPIPSKLDLMNTTTREVGAAKDHSANMWSILAYNGVLPPGILVSPLEKNPSIREFAGYAMAAPPAAVDPANALWDPAFTADFTTSVGGVSYATVPLTSARRDRWKSAAASGAVPSANAVPLVANRGPEVASVGEGGVGVSLVNPSSNTIGLGVQKKIWEGAVLFNDLHVAELSGFEDGWAAQTQVQRATYVNAGGKTVVDIPFFDEPDDPSRTNTYLGIFTAAGEKDSEFTAIWD